MNNFFLVIMLFLSGLAFSQRSSKYTNEYTKFYTGEDLFEKEQFAAARIEFRGFISTLNKPNDPLYVKALYYEGLAALELFNNDAVSLLETFTRNYPESIYKTIIFFKLGKFFYQKKDFKSSLEWFKQLNPSDVEAENREEFLFKLGYSYFQEKNIVAARNAFHDVKDGKTQYAAPSLYYYSHIAYTDKSYQVALDGFLKLQNDAHFGKAVPYYIAQIYYLQGNYEAVTRYAPEVLDTANVVNESDINHLVGDAYYRVGKFDEAVAYLERYNAKNTTTRTDDYQLGYALLKSFSYAKAIKYFDKAANKKDSLSQIAYYHIGECNLQLKNGMAARAAFDEAAKIDADAVVQEDALYNYVVLCYQLDLNPYDEAVIALEDYLKRFPNSKRKNDIYQYLVNVYTSTNNYAKALASLDKLPNKDTKLKTAYQLVAYNQGVEFFQKAEFREAIKSFELVDRYLIEPSISAKAKFWTADAYFRLNNNDKAIAVYKDFLAMPANLSAALKPDAYYNIGYAYLKKQDIVQSIEAFRLYCQSNVKNKNKLADAYMRAGDGYYMTKQNENAIKQYAEAVKLKAGFEDQALFYLGKSYGFANQENEKINQLLDLINNYKNSKYTLSAIYEVAASYKAKSEWDKALRYYNQLLNDYPNSTLIVKSKVEMGDIYYKKWEYNKAEAIYKELLENSTNDDEICASVVRGLVAVYAAMKQPEKGSNLAVQYPCANISVDEQEGMFYTPAIEAYNDSSYALAATNFEKYIEKFPTGKYSNDVNYYLANCYFETNNKEKAISLYANVLDKLNPTRLEFVSARMSQHLYNTGKYEDAIIYYERLEKISSKPAVLFNSKLGLMRCNFLVSNWENTVSYAKSVLESSQLNNTLRLEAEYAKGMSEYYQKNYSAAQPSLEWIIKNTTTVKAAEARYSLAEAYFQQQELKKADTEVRALIKMKPSYNFWVAKALILQTRVLMQQKDLFQAEQTLRSVIEHYTKKDDGIMDEAKRLMEELLQLKNAPKALDQQGETVIDVNEGGK
jgi:tetratricopeptide (TPR) repeat protein